MHTSIVMLIYEIVDYRCGLENDSLCCGHNWVFDSKWTGRSASYSSVGDLNRIFSYNSFLVVGRIWYLVSFFSFFFLLGLEKVPKVPFLSLLSFYLNERVSRETFRVLSSLMMISPAMLLFRRLCPSAILSHPRDGPPDFWRWVDT